MLGIPGRATLGTVAQCGQGMCVLAVLELKDLRASASQPPCLAMLIFKVQAGQSCSASLCTS